MDFITIRVTCQDSLSDYLMSLLFEIGFDAFQELEDGFEGSCEEHVFDANQVSGLLSSFSDVSFELKEQEKVNWNEEWEKNYDPIIIGDQCIVRASFHEPRPEFDYEIIVTPKMSFGTGHHATTYQILAYQMTLDHEGKQVLDVGTGTGVLAIMAQKRGAKHLVATDIDDWCIENSTENFELNGVKNYALHQYEIEELEHNEFDIIIANINKNVLLDQLGQYATRLKTHGKLILSGFYQEDMADLITTASKHALEKIDHSVKDNWAMLVLSKQSI